MAANGVTQKRSKESVANDKDQGSLLAEPNQNGTVANVEVTASDFVPPDGGLWGWLVCITSFWCNGTLFGILNTFGILFVALMDEFEDTGGDDLAFKIAWIGSLQIALTFMLSPVSSILVDRWGIRITAFVGATIATIGMFSSSFVTKLELFYLTYGVLLGAGSSLVYTPSMVILGHYFRKRLGIVNGVVSFGSAVFTFILPFTMKLALDRWGLRWTMRILSLLYAVLILCALTWKPQFTTRHAELDHYLKSDESPSYSRCSGLKKWIQKFCNVTIWKNKGYRIWAIALPVSFLGYFVPFVHLVKHANDVIPDAPSEALVMCLGATSGVSRLICGKVADIPKINRIRMQQFAFFVLGVSTICIPFAKNFWILVIIVLIMGVCDGCFICLLGPIAFDLLGPAGAAQGLGCLLGLMSIPMTAGPPLAGLAYDYMGTYTIAFFAAGAPPIIGACLLFLAPYEQQVVSSVSMCEAISAMSHENLDQIDQVEHGDYMGSQQFEWGSRRVISLRNIPIVVETDNPPQYSLFKRQKSRLDDGTELRSSVPDLRVDLLKKSTDKSEFSSIPHALNKV